MLRSVWFALAGAALVLLLAPGGGPARAVRPSVPAPVGPGEVYLAPGDSLATGDEAPANTAEEGDLPGYLVYLDLLLDYTQPISLTLLARRGIGRPNASDGECDARMCRKTLHLRRVGEGAGGCGKTSSVRTVHGQLR
jgi:hypothetical protein